jgi:hypothetical protein
MVKAAAPCEGTSYEIGGIALIKGARNKDAAKDPKAPASSPEAPASKASAP